MDAEVERQGVLTSSNLSRMNEDDQQASEEEDEQQQQQEEDGLFLSTDASGRLRTVQDQLRKSRLCVLFLSILSIVLFIDVILMLAYIVNYDENNNSSGQSSRKSIPSRPAWMKDVAMLDWKALPPDNAVLTRIAFGSCASQHKPQPYLDTLVRLYQPDLVLLLGDNVYGDCESDACPELPASYREWASWASVQGAAPRLSVFPALDDHDYGVNDCHGSNNPHKRDAQRYFVDFFQLGHREGFRGRYQHDDGSYRARIWGPPGRRVQIILLDTRYSRSPFLNDTDPDKRYRPPTPDEETTVEQNMLGQNQWHWLEKELAKPNVDLRIIASSIQVFNNVTNYECWRHLPRERQRLYKLLHDKTAIVVSGDRHVGGFYQEPSIAFTTRKQTATSTNTAEVAAVTEVTASAWTHAITYEDLGCSVARTECDEVDPTRIDTFIREDNFGSIDIDWEKRSVVLSLRRAADNNDGGGSLNTTANQVLQSRSLYF